MTTLDSVPASSSSPEDPRYRFVYDEAVRTIDHQEETLDNIRARAGVLLTATSVATSFLGAAALRDPNAGRWAVVAIILFVLAGVVCVGLLLPLPGWQFRFGARSLLMNYVDAPEPLDINEMYKDLALHLEDNYAHNKTRIGAMWWAFDLAASLLFLEVIAWLLAMA